MSSKRHHAEWLSLVEVSGPFLTMPVLERVFPQGLDAHDPEHYRNLRLAFEEWEAHPAKPVVHRAWIKYVLEQTLGLPEEVLVEGQAIPEALKATVSEHGETLRPDFIVRNPEDIAPAGQARLLVQVYPLEQDLEKSVAERHWKASPATRMMELLHATDVRLGLVTNGERWMIVYAPRGETTGYASWYASLWMEEKITLQAFRSLLGAHRFFNAPDDETPDAMLAESAKHQQEVTDQLGYQVRRAVETLIHSLDRADQDSARALLARVPETELYESALTVMMRLVFLFCAEERGLLLLGDPLYDQYYAVSTLIAQLQEAADQHGEEVLERRLDAWSRLLATFRAVYGGIEHERLKLPAYGGRLFDPDRFPFLEGHAAGTKWRETPANPLPVNNRTTLHLLRSLQYLEMQGEARRLSFRALDIEQIGHVYEGLLDHTAKRAATPVLGLIGTKGDEPEVALTELERLLAKGEDDLIGFLREQTGKSENTLRRLLEAELDTHEINRMRAACGNNELLFKRVRPFAALVRDDSFDRPVVIPQGSVYVTAGTDRRSSGTHYTPRSLTEPIVQYTLEPLVYVGPAEGRPKEEWRLHSPRELLDLKICDMACGSGAFLVQACRYLSERLVEAWEEILREHPGSPRITPEGAPATGALDEALIPQETDERISYAQRIIAQRCLYGVDKNPLAVEMAKLDLWLLTLAKDKPFTFLDHAIRRGDSLIGIHHLDQIRYFTLDLDNKQKSYFTGAVEKVADEVIVLRKRIEASPAERVEDAEIQRQLLAEAEAKTAQLRYAADLLIAVEFHGGNARQKEDWQSDAAIQASYYVENEKTEKFKEAAEKALNGQATFHWPLEFPEVFVERGGFDAFIGNPPFLPGPQISVNWGGAYRDWMKNIAPHAHGNSDYVCYFIVQAFRLTQNAGCYGLLATKSVAEGDSRLASLNWLLKQKATIYFAYSLVKWPGGASVAVCAFCVKKGTWGGSFVLDGQPASFIDDFLADRPFEEQPPQKLNSNRGIAFRGSILAGDGFIINQSDADRFIASEPNCAKVILPIIGGDDLNRSPLANSGYLAINLCDYSEEECRSQFGPLWEHLNATVRVQRESQDTTANQREFWKYWSDRPKLRQWLQTHDRVLAISQATKHFAFAFLPANCVHQNTLNLFTVDSFFDFGVIQSSIHLAWALKYSTSLESGTLRYTYSTCFETFPFPKPNAATDLGDIAQQYLEHRRLIMQTLNCGLTIVYNQFHDPEESSDDICRLRELHKGIDEAVARAYGWPDLRLNHGFYETKQGVRFTISEAERREILDLLLELNHQRYAEEEAQGLHEKGAKKKAKSGTAPRSKRAARAAPTLFGEDDDSAEEGASDYERPTPAQELETNDVMAAFRQALRGRGSMTRDELLKEVSLALGYRRLRVETEEVLRNHLRAAIRRKIAVANGNDLVSAATNSMEDYSLEELREVFASVMRSGRNYEREEVIRAVAEYLGFSRVTETTRQAIKSAFNSAIRQGMLGYEGDLIWQKE